MSDGEFQSILESIDRRLKEVWESIDAINKTDRKTEVKQTERLASIKERVAAIETQLTIFKWLFRATGAALVYIMFSAQSVF